MRNKKADPALQYAPYQSLKGFGGMLSDVRKKRTVEPRKRISEDQAAELNRTISLLRSGIEVYGEYYHAGHYRAFNGVVKKVDMQKKELILEDKVIAMIDIFELHSDATDIW